MKTQKISWTEQSGLSVAPAGPADADLVFYFGPRAMLDGPRWHDDLKARFPKALLLGCSSGGQLTDRDVTDQMVTGVAMQFERTGLKSVERDIRNATESRSCGRGLAEQLKGEDLAGIVVLSDGLGVNGSELVAGMVEILGQAVPICGGLAGDGAAFHKTVVGLQGRPRSGVVAAVGFYGKAVRIGHGNAGGWDVFGPSRVITRSSGNVLYELDGQPALDLYEKYLTPEDIMGLPGTALLYPMQIRNPSCASQDMVRTVLSVDREARSMTFAGDMPRGWSAQLMRSTFEHLAEGAANAVQRSRRSVAGGDGAGVALLISCIGRRLMMGQRVVDEIEAANANLPDGMSATGFYSYGEISPHSLTGFCELHNQTMTVMTIEECAA